MVVFMRICLTLKNVCVCVWWCVCVCGVCGVCVSIMCACYVVYEDTQFVFMTWV